LTVIIALTGIEGTLLEGEKMAPVYGYKIEKTRKGWIFVLYPSNSRTQPMAWSEPYATCTECISSLQTYPEFFAAHKIDSVKSEYVEINVNFSDN